MWLDCLLLKFIASFIINRLIRVLRSWLRRSFFPSTQVSRKNLTGASHGFDKCATELEQSERNVVLVSEGYIKEKPA